MKLSTAKERKQRFKFKVGQEYRHVNGTLHHVRKIVEDGECYMVVMRWWSPRKGWRYLVEDSVAFEVGLYKAKVARGKCACTRGRCCDHCWRRSAKADPCKVKGCENPAHHSGPHGRLNNTNDPIVLTAEDLKEKK